MARHDSPKTPTTCRALAVLAAAGLALGAGATTAAAATESILGDAQARPGRTDPGTGVRTLADSVGYVAGPVANAKPNPLAGTRVDPLSNAVSTQFGDFKPLDSRNLTKPYAQAKSIGSMPVVGEAARKLR